MYFCVLLGQKSLSESSTSTSPLSPSIPFSVDYRYRANIVFLINYEIVT